MKNIVYLLIFLNFTNFTSFGQVSGEDKREELRENLRKQAIPKRIEAMKSGQQLVLDLSFSTEMYPTHSNTAQIVRQRLERAVSDYAGLKLVSHSVSLVYRASFYECFFTAVFEKP